MHRNSSELQGPLPSEFSNKEPFSILQYLHFPPNALALCCKKPVGAKDEIASVHKWCEKGYKLARPPSLTAEAAPGPPRGRHLERHANRRSAACPPGRLSAGLGRGGLPRPSGWGGPVSRTPAPDARMCLHPRDADGPRRLAMVMMVMSVMRCAVQCTTLGFLLVYSPRALQRHM